MVNNSSYRSTLLPGILFVLAALLLSLFSARTIQSVAMDAEEELREKVLLMERAINLAERNSAAGEELSTLYNDDEIGLYFYRRDSLVYWNNSQIPLQEKLAEFPQKQGFTRLSHGFYFYVRTDSASRTFIALCQVKPIYQLQNNYLNNDFKTWTNIPPGLKITESGKGQVDVKVEDQSLFGLSGTEEYYHTSGADTASYLLFLSGVILLLISGLRFIKDGSSATSVLVLVLTVILARFLFLWLHWPAFLYRTVLYDVRTFGNAQSFINGYLGDVLLNSIIILFLAASAHFYFSRQFVKRNRNLALLTILLAFIVNAFNHTIKSLVSNSTLNFDFLNLFSVKLPAFAGLAAVCFYSISVFICVFWLIKIFEGRGLRDFLLFTGLLLIVCLVQVLTYESQNFLLECFWLLILSVLMFLLLRARPGSPSLALGVMLLIMAVIASRFLNIYISKNQQQELEFLALKLSERQDPVLESEFSSIPTRITNDENLGNLMNILPASAEGVQTLLRQKFFSGYFDRYNVEFSLFDKNCNPLLPVKDGLLDNEGYFTDEIKFRSDSASVENLFFVRDFQKNTRYIARIPLKDKNLYILMEAKQFEELGSFPDLLLDRSQQKHEKLKTFSHGVYRSQQLASHYGVLNYPVFLQDSATMANSHQDYINRYYEPDSETVIIISERKKNWNYFFTFNSYLLLFFSIITYSSYLVYAAFFTSQFQNPSLTRRIQTIIIVLLLVAMSAIGYTSGTLVTGQFEQDNKKLLEEKTQVIINELSQQLDLPELFEDSRRELVNLKLKEYARLFNTPISLFDKNGFLYNTSESKLYDLGLAASLANPSAFEKLRSNRSSTESVVEEAGTLTYLSFYTPLFNQKRELLGFVNLPYFAKVSALENELSGIISALINVYVILFVISILAGLILSGYITQPLRLIKQQIANISLGKQNEKISWQSNDEIGRLVAEYNDMLVKLENSANLLAQSERESAWREMAKQVAHEIKNPLTPMKLNLQYLQHVMKNEPGDFKEKFEKASQGIIEQIDSLANIATEFSNFAKLPGTELRSLNLRDIISASVALFANQANIKIINSVKENILVQGDHDQCLRVFNNILKNSVQALEGVEDPWIRIDFEENGEHVTVSVQDNGCGIAEEDRVKLFTPNFTTKNTGSGLGLAMVKNIMEGFGGSVWCENSAPPGITFKLQFKKMA